MTDIVKEHASYVEKRWTHREIECAILAHPRGFCKNGYVRVPESVELPEDDYADFDVHGGITWGPDEGRWVGFDTGHTGDFWPDLPSRSGRSGDLFLSNYGIPPSEWTDERLVAEVERLAEQVAGRSDA